MAQGELIDATAGEAWAARPGINDSTCIGLNQSLQKS